MGRLVAGAAIVASGLLLVYCSDVGKHSEASGVPARKYYADIALPAHKPRGLTYVHVGQMADPVRDKEQVELVFGFDTVYVCRTPPEGAATSGVGCLDARKRTVRTVDLGRRGVTVYAIATRTAGSMRAATAARTLRDVEMSETTPEWFVQMLRDQKAW